MNKHLYEKMALTNIKKNKKIYFPYLLTTIGSLMFYYILTSLGVNPAIYDVTTRTEAFKGAHTLCGILQSGSFIASVFAFIFLLYANSFVLKHQKKQFGLYRVLGMERKHIIRIISVEVFLIFAFGIIGGLFFGILFDRLMLVLLLKIIGQTAPTGFTFHTTAILQTLLLAGIIAALILLRSLFCILSAKDIELLKSDKMGEKELKYRPLTTLIGFVFLGIGYAIALKTTNAGNAIGNFFPAAFLVMSATYTLFTTGSTSILNRLKKNKKFYYTTKHFTSVSGLLYRMKTNAVGLSTICILSTAAIIVLSAGASLYANGEHSINKQFPRTMQFDTETKDSSAANEILKKTIAETNFEIEDYLTCSYGTSLYAKTDTGIAPMDDLNFTGFDNMPDTFILTLDEYNRFNKTNETLKETEILLYATDNFYTQDSLTFLDTTYRIKDIADKSCLDYITDSAMSLFSKLLIVVPNEDVYNSFVSAASNGYSLTWTGFNSPMSTNDIIAFSERLNGALASSGIETELSVKQLKQQDFYNMYGGILFVGVALGLLFIISTVMIIYYKQISEGYEDRERFIIMQKVGLSKEEIKKSIHSQIMLIFFLPLVTAVIHSAVALKIVANCLRMVVIVHMPTFVLSAVATCVIFSIIYAVVYKITSLEYYRLVNE